MQFLSLVLLREAVVIPPRRENKNSDLLMIQGHSIVCRILIRPEGAQKRDRKPSRANNCWREFTCLNAYVLMSDYLIIAFCPAEVY